MKLDWPLISEDDADNLFSKASQGIDGGFSPPKPTGNSIGDGIAMAKHEGAANARRALHDLRREMDLVRTIIAAQKALLEKTP